MSDSRPISPNAVAGSYLVLLWLAFSASHVRHVVLMDSLLGTVLQAVIPLTLSLGVLWVGVSVFTGHLVAPDDVRRFVIWVTVGVVLLLLVALWLLAHEYMMGHLPGMALSLVVNSATVGALLGISVGVYDSRRRQSQRALSRQNDRLDQFASIVAHDIRNPLGVAMGRVEVARDERESEHLELASDALAQMDRLVDDVLALARIGNEVVEPEWMDLESAAAGAWRSAGAETASLEVVGDLHRIQGDLDRVQQLFENLFRNAVEHGGIDVDVRVGRAPNGFYVEDDGPGIPAEDREKVFEYGYTTASSTGFGLAIIKTIVEAHDWSVTISNTDNGGTRFEFGDVVYGGRA